MDPEPSVPLEPPKVPIEIPYRKGRIQTDTEPLHHSPAHICFLPHPRNAVHLLSHTIDSPHRFPLRSLHRKPDHRQNFLPDCRISCHLQDRASLRWYSVPHPLLLHWRSWRLWKNHKPRYPLSVRKGLRAPRGFPAVRPLLILP